MRAYLFLILLLAGVVVSAQEVELSNETTDWSLPTLNQNDFVGDWCLKGSYEVAFSISESDFNNRIIQLENDVILESSNGINLYRSITANRIRLKRVISPSTRVEFQVPENTNLPIFTSNENVYYDRCEEYLGS